MASKSLIINAVGNVGENVGKKYQKSVTFINPAASNEVAGEFARRANALTTNVFNNAQVVKKMDVNEEDTVTLTVDDSRIKNRLRTVEEYTVSTIEGGIRIAFNAEDGNGHGMTPENTYIDVTY